MSSDESNNETENRTEQELDSSMNDVLNKVDGVFMEDGFTDLSAIVFLRGMFSGKKAKTVMAFRKSERNQSESSEVIIHMLMFLFKKLGFREENVRKFIVEQLKEEHPEAQGLEEELESLLSPNSPN